MTVIRILKMQGQNFDETGLRLLSKQKRHCKSSSIFQILQDTFDFPCSGKSIPKRNCRRSDFVFRFWKALSTFLAAKKAYLKETVDVQILFLHFGSTFNFPCSKNFLPPSISYSIVVQNCFILQEQTNIFCSLQESSKVIRQDTNYS